MSKSLDHDMKSSVLDVDVKYTVEVRIRVSLDQAKQQVDSFWFSSQDNSTSKWEEGLGRSTENRVRVKENETKIHYPLLLHTSLREYVPNLTKQLIQWKL